MLAVVAPALLHVEIVNVAARRWLWQRTALIELARGLKELAFTLREPELHDVAEWTARGLTAHDASYVALAEAEGIKLITDDQRILTVATNVSVALSTVGKAAPSDAAEPE